MRIRQSRYFNPRAHEGHDGMSPTYQGSIRFQSTCPRGARQHPACAYDFEDISIHVPTRGTTVLFAAIFNSSIDFNPRAHEGHDLLLFRNHLFILFQSTCPRGARLQASVSKNDSGISIHVPTRGTTTSLVSGTVTLPFQSTCPRGARRGFQLLGLSVEISIHVPTRGTTI